MSDDQIIEILMEVLDGFKTDDEFETFIANAKMLWAARDAARALVEGKPVSIANN